MFRAIFLGLSMQGGDGFMPIDASDIDSVSAKSLLIGAYAAIFAILIIYAASLFWRQKRAAKAIKELDKLGGFFKGKG